MDGLDRLTGFEIVGWGDDGDVVNGARRRNRAVSGGWRLMHHS